MRRRIFFFTALLSALAVIATSIIITAVSYNTFFDTVKQEVRAQAAYIQVGIETGGMTYFDRLTDQSGHRLTYIAQDGTVVFDSVSNPARMDNHADRPEVQAALSGGSGEMTRYSDTIFEQTYYYAIRLHDGSVLRVSSTVAGVVSSYDKIFWMVGLIAVAVIALAALAASWETHRMIRPINAIDLDQPEHSKVYDELVPLLSKIREQKRQIATQISELDRGRREFTAITQNMAEGFLVLDRDGKILSYNQSALGLLGVDVRHPVGCNILALNRSEPLRTAVQAALGGTAKEAQLLLGQRHCQMYASPVVAGEEVQGMVVLIMDTTEKQARETLRREFSANVSHELKTPLTAISGYAELMTNGIVKPEDVPEFSGYIYAEAQRLITLVRDLMLLSKLDEEDAQPELEPVELLELCGAVARRLQSQADSAQLALAVSGDEAQIMGIAFVLDEIVFNLLDNAIKYSEPGGRVAVCVTKKEGGAVLTVSDTGRGIPPAEQERVFERFYRVDKSRGGEIPGTGLGLAIVKHGAMLHGASVTLKSSPEGTCFTVTFPIS